MRPLNAHTALIFLLLMGCAPACFDEHLVDHSSGAPQSSPDMSDGAQGAGPDVAADEVLAAMSPLHDGLVVDGEVYRGMYVDGTEYEGISGESVEVDLSGRPSWQLALWHASLIARDGGVALTPDEILAAGVVSSKLDCAGARCFGLESGVHWDPLTRFFADRFPQGERASMRFASSALIFSYYQSFALALWVKDTPEPARWLATHEDDTFGLQVRYIAHVWSAWWEGFGVMFDSCQTISAPECVTSVAVEQRYIQDQLGALVAVREALSGARPVREAIRREDVQRYLDEISWLFPHRDEAGVSSVLDRAYALSNTLDTPAQILGMLDALHDVLERAPRAPWMRAELCARRVLEPEVCP